MEAKPWSAMLWDLLAELFKSGGLGWWVLSCWLLVEVVFWGYIKVWLHPRMSAIRKPVVSPRTPKKTMELLVDTLDNMRDHYCSKRFISGWFNGVPYEEVKRDNFRELMAWAVYASHVEDLSEPELRVIDEGVTRTIEKFGLEMEPGYNPDIKACRMNLESLSYIHRPFSYYLSIYCVQALGNLLLYLFGFHRMEERGQVYWYREGPSNSDQLPLLFFHGISLGLAQYLTFALPLAKNRTALLFEAPHISMSLHNEAAIEPPTRLETLEAIESICKRHGLEESGVMAVGHSFGSIPTGWLATFKPDLVAQAVFIDPVCFLLLLPDICRNFLYRRPKSLIEYAIYYLFARETTINNALKRHFWWYENICVLEEIQCPVVIALAGNDEVLPAETVRAYVEKHTSGGDSTPSKESSVDLIWWHNRSHAECLISQSAMGDLLAATRKQQERLGIKPRRGGSRGASGNATTLHTAPSHGPSPAVISTRIRRLSTDYREN